MFDNTEEFKQYQQGVDYNTKLDYYSKTDLHWNFYNSKQWIGIVTNGLSKWTFNICKTAINYFIAFIMSQKVKMQYSAENLPDEPIEQTDIDIKTFVEQLSNMADMKWEKDKMDSLLRELMLDGANAGDFSAHVYWDATKETGQLEKGDFTTEAVDGVNVLFGNPNNKKVEAQPYIIIVGREMVSKLKEEAKKNGIEEDLIKQIIADQENTYQAGTQGKVELESKDDTGKCLYLIKYWKENGTVLWNKSTKYCPIVKKRDLGINRYPIAWGNWESIKNSYHGIGATEGMIDNQISINQMFAMVSYWMRMCAFGKTVIDSSRIKDWSNKIGEVVKADGPVSDMVYQLQAGNFNQAILTVIDMAIKYTKEFIGANDALMGQVDPEQASGVAIISTAKQASTPLGNIAANRDQFVEDLGLIWGEFFLKKYKNRKVSYKENEKVVVNDYSTEGMENILLQCKVDVGPSTYFSEIAGIQELARLLSEGQITKLQYFERMAKMNIIPDCQGLIDDANAEMNAAKAQVNAEIDAENQTNIDNQNAEQDQANQEQQAKEQQWTQMVQFLKTLPKEVQQKIMSLPQEQQEPTILKLMNQDVNNSMKESAQF